MSAKKSLIFLFKFFSRALVILLTLLFLGVAFLFWRLSVKPLDLEFLMPEIQEYILPADEGLKLEADSVLLSARFSRRGLFHISVHNLSLMGKDNSLILDIPDIQVSYGLRNLFTLNYMPLSAYVSDMLLQLTLTADGRLLLQGQEGKAVSIAQVQKEGPMPKVIYHHNRYIKRLMTIRHIVLNRAGVIIADELNDRRIMIPELTATLERQRFTQYIFDFKTNLLIDEDLMHLNGNALINLGARTAEFELAFDQVNLAKAGRIADLMNGIQLNVQGTVQGELDFHTFELSHWRNIFKSLSFTVETEQSGRVVLPAPLDAATYNVSFIKATGTFAENLESLSIQPIQAGLTNKLTATADIQIQNSGSFLDTFDISGVKTTLNAQIKDIPVHLVPEVWPSGLGPDAHAWVKQNLKDGKAANAVFKLYFTGAALTDLLGDIDFQDMTVDYLSPMKPVKNAAGKVMLYPDKVEIFAHSGEIDNIHLQEGNIYLTELKDDISNAHIELRADGPAPEILALIDEKPLELLSGFDIDPANTAGDVSGEANLRFPLKESLTAKEVQVNMTASVSNGMFQTKDRTQALTNAALGVVIDNTQMIVKGSGQYKDMPLDVVWTEFFAPTKKNPLQRRLEAQGKANDLFFKPYYKDISDYLIGMIKGQVTYEQTQAGEKSLRVKADLTDAELMLYPLAYTKFKGVPAAAEAFMRLNGAAPESITFDVTADKKALNVSGEISFPQNGVKINITQAQAPGTQFSGQMTYISGQELSLDLKGKSWLLTEMKNLPYFKSKAIEAEPKQEPILPLIRLNIAMDSLTLNPNLPLKQVAVKANRTGRVWKEFFIFAQGAGSLSVSLGPDGKALTGVIYDTGDILNRFNLTDDFASGKATLTAAQDANGLIKGNIKVKNMNLKDPGFVMQALTIIGIIDAFRGKELHFSQASVPFTLTPNFVVIVTDGALYGTSLGITFEGYLKQGYMNIKGSVIPAYALNSLPGKIPLIGGLFRSSAHGGLVGASYSVKGEPSSAKVEFHPLSSIAPGILGRLFQ